MERAASGQDRDLLARVQHLGRVRQLVLGGEPRAAGVHVRRVVLDVPLRPVGAGVHLLDVDRERDVGDATVGERCPAREVGDVLDVRGAHDALAVLRDVHEQPIKGYVLLGVGADEVVVRHAGNGKDGLAVEGRVVEPVQGENPARARGRQADAQLAGELGVATGHQSRGFLVADLNEADLVTPLAQRLHEAVDPVAREAEDDLDAPVPDRLDQNVRRRECHAFDFS